MPPPKVGRHGLQTAQLQRFWNRSEQHVHIVPPEGQALGVHRPDFLQVLTKEATCLGANVRKGYSAQAIEEQPSTSWVTFTNGDKRAYDLVIGADGIGSRARELIFPDAEKPAYTGQMSIRWMAPGPFVEGEGWFHSSVGRLGFYYVPQGLFYIAAVISKPTWSWTRMKKYASSSLACWTPTPPRRSSNCGGV